MIFDTRISGIPCQINVRSFTPYAPMCITGSGFGDADPPENEELEYEVLDRKGYRAKWLESKITPNDNERIYEEFHLQMVGERYGYL